MSQEAAEQLVADGMVSVAEASRLTDLSQAEIYNLMADGTLPYAKHGKRRLIPRKSITTHLASRMVGVEA